MDIYEEHDDCITTVKTDNDAANWVEIVYRENDEPVRLYFEVHGHDDRFAQISWSEEKPE